MALGDKAKAIGHVKSTKLEKEEVKEIDSFLSRLQKTLQETAETLKFNETRSDNKKYTTLEERYLEEPNDEEQQEVVIQELQTEKSLDIEKSAIPVSYDEDGEEPLRTETEGTPPEAEEIQVLSEKQEEQNSEEPKQEMVETAENISALPKLPEDVEVEWNYTIKFLTQQGKEISPPEHGVKRSKGKYDETLDKVIYTPPILEIDRYAPEIQGYRAIQKKAHFEISAEKLRRSSSAEYALYYVQSIQKGHSPEDYVQQSPASSSQQTQNYDRKNGAPAAKTFSKNNVIKAIEATLNALQQSKEVYDISTDEINGKPYQDYFLDLIMTAKLLSKVPDKVEQYDKWEENIVLRFARAMTYFRQQLHLAEIQVVNNQDLRLQVLQDYKTGQDNTFVFTGTKVNIYQICDKWIENELLQILQLDNAQQAKIISAQKVAVAFVPIEIKDLKKVITNGKVLDFIMKLNYID